MSEIRLEHVTAANEVVRALVAELDDELAAPYAADQHHGFSVESIFQSEMKFFVAFSSGKAVGCGGVAFEDGFAEVKRMYVRASARGQGVAQAILARLEAEALEKGYRRLTLETGDVQHAAIKIYQRAGFSVCPAFGDYLSKEPHTIERSVFFEKSI